MLMASGFMQNLQQSWRTDGNPPVRRSRKAGPPSIPSPASRHCEPGQSKNAGGDEIEPFKDHTYLKQYILYSSEAWM